MRCVEYDTVINMESLELYLWHMFLVVQLTNFKLVDDWKKMQGVFYTNA